MTSELFRGPYELKIDTKKFNFIFPKQLDNLRITDIALYSMILAPYSQYMINLIKNICGNYGFNLKDTSVFDLGSNIGGTLYYFLQHSKSVTGIEYEPLHVDITNHNLKLLCSPSEFNKLTLLYGDVENIFMTNNTLITNTYKYNSIEPNEISVNKKPYKCINSIKGLSSGKKLFYIGTPFIDLAFGSTLVDELILNIHKLHKPTMFVVQLPCNIANDVHNNFYNKLLPKLLHKLHPEYHIKFYIDIKKNNVCSNLHLILINKVMDCKVKIKENRRLFIQSSPELEIILNKLAIKYDIDCITKKFKLNGSWKPVYYNSLYKNATVKGDKVIIHSYTRDTKDKVKHITIKSTIPHRLIDSGVKNGSVLVKYDRFNDKVVSLL